MAEGPSLASPGPDFVVVETPEKVDVMRTLFQEYAAMPHVQGRWPGMQAELDALPEPYVPPAGVCLLAERDGRSLGCVALNPLDPPEICEMKRMYVREHARGEGLARALSEALMAWAREAGYAPIRAIAGLNHVLGRLRGTASYGRTEYPPTHHDPTGESA